MQNKVSNSDEIINGLKKENEQMGTKLAVAAEKLDFANQQLDDRQRDIILQWFYVWWWCCRCWSYFGFNVATYSLVAVSMCDRWMN